MKYYSIGYYACKTDSLESRYGLVVFSSNEYISHDEALEFVEQIEEVKPFKQVTIISLAKVSEDVAKAWGKENIRGK